MSESRASRRVAQPTTRDAAEGLERLFAAKAAAEVKTADLAAPGSDAVASRGALLAEIAVVKGRRGPAENAGGAAMSGADGEKMSLALEALGHDVSSVYYTLSRSEPGLGAAERAARLKALIEAVDPELVVATDPEAAEDLACAFGVEALAVGAVTRVSGRRFVALSGFEDSLVSDEAKRPVWEQLKAAAPRPAVY
jgi:hypothetical protein